MTTQPIEQLAINTIRTLAMDAVQAAGSGHPGTPMALAPAAYVLFNEVLRFDPQQAHWPNRDRFVLSCGHASMLLYSMLHLCGVKQADGGPVPNLVSVGEPEGDSRIFAASMPQKSGQSPDEPAVSLDDIRRFRQLGSRCPGHPEHGHTTGVETTTGPLGQGIGNSVGMALAARWLASRYNRPGFDLFDYDVYAFCSDGDLMEGLGSEAASIAGHLKLSNLCWLYDDNGITIEGRTSLAFSEDVGGRFAAYGWNVLRVEDVNDLAALRAALAAFRRAADRPTLVIVRSVIAWGAPNKHNTHGAHGAPLGVEEVRLTKAAYGWPEDAQFLVPDGVRAHFDDHLGQRGRRLRQAWEATFERYKAQYPDLAGELEIMRRRELPADWDALVAPFPADAKGLASRASSSKVLNQLGQRVPWLMGGSADLAPSTLTLIDKAGDFEAGDYAGRNLHFGIREHAMGAICNGMALCGLRSYGATFFVFADYMRPAIRMAAIMGLPVLLVFTHDSIGVGEDGPTHQPIEHLASLRAIPNLVVIRPGDANEVAAAYRVALQEKHRPVALVLTRQNIPTLDRTKCAPAAGTHQGGYILADAPDGRPELILIGTGSELSLCVGAHARLAAEGVRARVVSLPSWELFDEQPPEYRNAVLPPGVTRRLAVELGIEQGWCKYLGPGGRFLGMRSFGESAPVGVLLKHYGFTVDNVVAAAKELLGQ
ncbi:MAG: transketolase [Thermoguttaceae bacterium]|jgi:transketolase